MLVLAAVHEHDTLALLDSVHTAQGDLSIEYFEYNNILNLFVNFEVMKMCLNVE
jgi:hypothetical protein